MALTDRDTSSNYLGELFLLGAVQTPFLSMIGGLDGQRSKITRSMKYPMAQPYSLAAAAIPAIDEDELVTAGTPNTVARGQDLNTVMIFKQDVEVSYLKEAAYGELAGLSAIGDQPVTDELAFQKSAALKKIGLDAELAFLTGTYADAVNSSTAAQTNGIITGITTSAVAAGAAKLSKSLVDTLLRTMAAAGALFENSVIFCNAYQKQQLSDIYGYAPEDRNVGGINIKQIETDFATLGICYDPQMPTDTLGVFDLNYVFPVFLPHKGRTLFYEDLAKTAGSDKGQMIGFIGIDYGAEEFHGKITGLATS